MAKPDPKHNPVPPSRRTAAQIEPKPAFGGTRPKEEVVKRDTMLPVKTELAALLMEDEGLGREGMGAKDLAIPRLSVLQALSPQCSKADQAYIKGAEPGMLFDNVESRMWDGEVGIIVIPVTYRRANLEWKLRAAGGGFVKDHGIDDTILTECTRKEETGQLLLPSGNEVIETAEYYCVMIDPDTKLPRQVVISMAKTQFKKAKLWNSMISNLRVPKPDGTGVFNPAIFYKSYKLTTVPQSNDKGSWYGWKIEPYKDTLELEGGTDLYLGSRSFRKAVAAGEVKVADHEAPLSADGGEVLDQTTI